MQDAAPISHYGCIAIGIPLLPISVASWLLLVSGVWWTGSVLAWITWERMLETPGRRQERLRERAKPRSRLPAVLDTLQFGFPSVVTVGLALDGLLGSRLLFYSAPWTIALPGAEVIQGIGAALVFIALPLFTAGAYLTGKHVYSRLPQERTLMGRGPYRYIRHPIYLAFCLLGVGWFLLAENIVAVIFLLMLQGALYATREEKELVKTYGDAYVAYQQRTGRFLPRFRKAT